MATNYNRLLRMTCLEKKPCCMYRMNAKLLLALGLLRRWYAACIECKAVTSFGFAPSLVEIYNNQELCPCLFEDGVNIAQTR